MSAARTAPPDLKALGRRPFPQTVQAAGRRYRLVRVYKHDFFAATGLMEAEDGRRAVLKIGREAPVLGLPAAWIGALLARREVRIYRALQGLEGIPGLLGTWGRCGFLHEWVPGHPLARDEAVADDFFERLQAVIDAIHRRDVAYVDLEKCSNVLVDDHGRPWLIDFQVSWHWPGAWGRVPPLSWVLHRLQRMDGYHLLKHRRRTRPDQLSPEQLDASTDLPLSIRLHRRLVAPLQRIRRGFLRRVDPDHASAPR